MSDEPTPVGEAAAGIVRALRGQLREQETEAPMPADVFDPETRAAMEEIRAGRHQRDRWVGWWMQQIPSRFQQAALDAPRPGQESAYEQVRAWADSAGVRPNLVLVGPTGSGKSHLACAAVRSDVCERGYDVTFAPVVTMLDRLRPDGGARIDDYVNVTRIILDDFAMERSTDWTHERLSIVVNDRWLDERPTVATTNLPPKELRESIGERLFSRLCGSDALVVAVNGPDRRLER